MQDIYDVIENVNNIYDSNSSFEILKDFERVIDELDVYVYKNWKDGELVSGPKISRHWVSCSFMWPANKMPDPMGGKRLLDYDCKVSMGKDSIIKPRKIRKAEDVRPGTKKGKLDKHAIWLVQIDMPKKLIQDIYSGYDELLDYIEEPGMDGQSQELQAGAADQAAAGMPAPAAPVDAGMAGMAEPPVEGGVV
jgi:hypothetical protein|tara:strand:+ start:198 stop:776 length:579 start_codon:yes stop_codon:yes gene_type:complete